jgi:hypothetical protein
MEMATVFEDFVAVAVGDARAHIAGQVAIVATAIHDALAAVGHIDLSERVG